MNYKIENDITLKEGDGTSKEVVNMSEKILLAEIRDLYSSNNCEDVIEKSIKKIYKILKRSDINSAFKNSFRKKVDIPIHKIFKDRIEYFTTDYIDTLTNAYTILFILTKYLRYLENQLRDNFDFSGTGIQIEYTVRVLHCSPFLNLSKRMVLVAKRQRIIIVS